jgi:hypothetical protein
LRVMNCCCEHAGQNLCSRPRPPVSRCGVCPAGGARGEVLAMMEPVEFPDEEHEQILERVAAIDVAKATGMVCTRVPHDSRPGRRVTRVWEVPATTNALIELGEYLAALGIEKVTLQSTTDYVRREGA